MREAGWRQIALINEDVLGFEVSMNEVLLVNLEQPIAYVPRY